MAKVGEEVQYESDPEQEQRPMGLRRREAASDDEEGVGGEKPRMDRRASSHSDESDGQGGAAEYDNDYEEELYGEEEEEEVYEDEEEEEVYEDDEIDGYQEGKDGIEESREVSRAGGGREVKETEVERKKVEEEVEVKAMGNHAGEEEEEEEGRRENEPFAVPTAGAFYMHDDRFRDNAGGRHRRTYGGRKLWESKDDKKWGHDKFEEMTLQERHYEQGRRVSKGRYQARGGKSRGPDRGYLRKNRSKAFSNFSDHNQAAKVVRGRGPRKYEPTTTNSGHAYPMQSKQPGKLPGKTLHGSFSRAFMPTSNAESDQVPPPRKNSILSSASPPFYPAGSSNKDIILAEKRDIEAGSRSRNLHTPVMDEISSMQHTSALIRGKNIANSVGMDNLYIDSVTPAAERSLDNVIAPSGSSFVSTMQSFQSRAQGRGVAISGQISYQPNPPLRNQVNAVSPAARPLTDQRSPAQNRIQPSIQASGQQTGQRSASGSEASSPKTAPSTNSYEPGEVETTSESSKSKSSFAGKGKSNIQGSGRGSFLYGGAQVMGATGNIGAGHGDQNFPATPAFLPVMQFGGQHPGGIGVPTVGMAFPGYVAQPQVGLGNSEMAWLPVLAGAAGALGATYCSPYIAVDGAYHPRQSGQTSSVGSSSKENNSNKLNDERKPSQGPEIVSDEFGQRQKPRRYSEMDFKQPSTST